MSNDTFTSAGDSLTAPARACFEIVPSDTLDLLHVTKAIYVGTGGDIALHLVDTAQPVIFRNVPDGAILDVRVKAVRASGTTSADVIGLR